MAENKQNITREDILTAAKQGLNSAAWKAIVKIADLGSPGLNMLRAAIMAGETIIEYQKEKPNNFATNKENIKDKANYAPRGDHQVFCSDNGSIALKDDGTVSMAAGTVSHLELDPGGNLIAENVDTTIKTNFFSLDADDIVINNHKLNQKLYELADFKQVLNTYDGTPKIAGGLTMLGTVLVKAWEPNLQRYVLVRRQVNMPVFSPAIGGAVVNPGLNITPETEFIRKFKKALKSSGIQSYGDLMSGLEAARAAAVMNQEKATAAANEKIKQENKTKQAISMTTLTGQQNAGGSVSPSQVAVGTVPQQNNQNNNNSMTPTNKPNVEGWDAANNRPNDPETYWYKVECRAHNFYVMKGHNVIESWKCNTSSFGSTTNKAYGDNKTPIGIFKIENPENIPKWELTKGCKYPNEPGVFGPWYTEINLGGSLGTTCHIAVHGDYPSENNSNILLTDAAFGKDAVPGQGSTHGCVRLLNENVTTFATKYAKAGQYIKIEA